MEKVMVRSWVPWVLMLALCGGLALGGCARPEAAASDLAEGDTATEDDDAQDLVPVELVTLGTGRIESVLRFSTNLEAESEVQVFSQAARLVTELRVEEGDSVRRGQLLLRLQDEAQRSAVAQAEIRLRKAEREYERQQNLFGKQLISEQAFNDATFEVEQLRLALDDAKRELGYTEVRAPIGGTITSRQVNLGDHITMNQHLFDIVDFDSIVARIFVPEKEMTRLRTGQAARIRADSLGGDPRTGTVQRIAPVVDSRSGTLKTTVAIPRNQGLLPGMYVEVELVTDVHEDALLVPKQALIYDNDQAFLFRVVEGSAATQDAEAMEVERLRTTVLLEDQMHIEPEAGVLAVGDRVILAGQAGLKDGAQVRATRAERGPQPADG